jgi:ankyrin repeat protein
MGGSKDLRAWVQTASVEEFACRINAEPGLLDSCDSGGDHFWLLHHAAALGRLDLIKVLLERGVGVDAPSGTPEEYGDTEAERPKFEPGFTPLMCAAAHGQLATVRHLISIGADPFKTDYHGGTALHSAAASGSAPIVNVLLAAGCDPDAECGYKANCEELAFYWVGTPLHIAAAADHEAATRALIGHGATVDALGMLDERRPLHYAAAKGA